LGIILDNATSPETGSLAPTEAELLDHFGRLLNERIECGTCTCEDAIRYTFFHSLISNAGYRHFDISLEEPLPYHPTRRVDTVVRNRRGEREMIVEFKYHRTKLASQPKPQLAGSLYCDLFRLAFAQAKIRSQAFLVYVTDKGMAEYLSKPKHDSHGLFLLGEGASITIGSATIARRPNTFLKALKGFSGYPATIRCAYRRDFRNGEELVVFSVTHLPDTVYDWD
jgi:hypothetical protein